MSLKSRGNYPVGWCAKTECKYHGGYVCGACYKFSKYKKEEGKVADRQAD